MAARSPFAPWLARWRLAPDGAAFTTRFKSRLMPVRQDGAPAMLKLAARVEERRGAALMVWWAGRGAARVLACEGEALLLERLDGPGDLAAMARGGQDDAATAILCDVAADLHAPRGRPPPASLVPLDVWFRALEPAARQHGATFAKAAEAARALLAEPRETVVLHGDLHHGNVLDGGPRGWLAIDPKGLIGERGFEYANLFRNPDAATALSPGRMRRQAKVVAERAGLERGRLLRWVQAYAGLGAAWSLGSGHDQDAATGLAIAELAAAELAT
ncbi:MAG: aminoglycoside phosphotransferase family protein [Caulobacteraceae bacterium]|nr:aminoglycoside phosphotransferase family protein [Caulobacteraceae bacterium]